MLAALEALPKGAVWVEREAIEAAPAASGVYALVLTLDAPLDCRHKGADIRLGPGVYVYAGSAYGPGGLRARLRRHFRTDKRLHWHIDALTSGSAARAMTAFIIEGGRECAIVARLMESGAFQAPVPGFGSSDCASCTAHLLMARA